VCRASLSRGLRLCPLFLYCQKRGFLHIRTFRLLQYYRGKRPANTGTLERIFNLSLYVVRNTSSYARRIGGIYDIFKRLSDVVYIKTLVGSLVAMLRNYQPG
jgi:hypothetical protein